MSRAVLYIVIPCHNEEECLAETTKRLTKKISKLVSSKKISSKSCILYVDDGSRDKTWSLITSLDGPIIGLKLSRNRGHQNALLAGLLYAKESADIVISMDADLQDDINVIDQMLVEYKNGNEIVYGVRKNRKKDSVFKRTTARLFYVISNFMGAETIRNAADCRLMTKRAICELEKYHESNLFLRGMVPLIGFKSSKVEYIREKRFAGKSKYPFKKMFNFALDGITSFSIKPLRLILSLGVTIFIISILMTLYALISWLNGQTVEGWTFIACSLWMLGGIQMMSIGVLGEYIGKVYIETKQRPRYVIEEIFKKH